MIWIWLVLAGLAAFLFHQLWYRRLKYPDGPTPLPLIGNVLSFKGQDRWEDKLCEWKKKYGAVYTYWMGTLPIVAINDYKLAVDLFIKDGDSYADKYSASKMIAEIRGGMYGIIETSGEEWRTQRRFALKVLRDFGLGKNVMQDRILEEVQTLIDNVNKWLDENDEDAEIDFKQHTNLAIGSLINNVVCGYRFSTDGREHEYQKIRESLDKLTNPPITFSLIVVAIMYALNIKIPFLARYYDRVVKQTQELMNFVDRVADERIKTTDYTQIAEPRDLIDAYMMAALKSEQETGQNLNYTRNHLRNTGADIWLAGLDTLSATINWTIAYLIVYWEEQQKLHEELDRVIGSNRLVTVADRPNLPYVCAVVMEAQRCANVIVQNLPRMTCNDVTIQGRVIPKGAICIPQISTIMMDETVFKDPKRFNPSRFIDENGQFRPKDEVLPFSIGKRACMGESLARMEMFLLVANVFNQYKFFAGTSPPIFQKFPNGIMLNIKPYLCRIKRRY